MYILSVLQSSTVSAIVACSGYNGVITPLWSFTKTLGSAALVTVGLSGCIMSSPKLLNTQPAMTAADLAQLLHPEDAAKIKDAAGGRLKVGDTEFLAFATPRGFALAGSMMGWEKGVNWCAGLPDGDQIGIYCDDSHLAGALLDHAKGRAPSSEASRIGAAVLPRIGDLVKVGNGGGMPIFVPTSIDAVVIIFEELRAAGLKPTQVMRLRVGGQNG